MQLHTIPWAAVQGAQQAKTGAALKKLQELQAAEAAPLDEREIQIAGIEVGNQPSAMLAQMLQRERSSEQDIWASVVMKSSLAIICI